MVHLWEAEQVIEPIVALQFIQQQFPALQANEIELLGKGWDNTAYLINQQYVFRFPRRQIAVSLLENESFILPLIVPHLPLTIPFPKWKGTMTQPLAWPFLGYQKILGISACQAHLSEQEKYALATPLAHFLHHLHAIPLSKEISLHLPGDLLNRLQVKRLTEEAIKNLNTLYSLELIHSVKPYEKMIEHSQNLVSSEKKVIVHGDVYVRHLVVNSQHELTGVIDWGDVHLGNCAVDLAAAHSFLPIYAHDLFRKTYGEIEEKTWQLARLRALYHSTILGIYGHHIQDFSILREALWSLKQIQLQND